VRRGDQQRGHHAQVGAGGHRVPEQLLPALLEHAILAVRQVAVLVRVEAADREHDRRPLDAAQREQRLHELGYGQPPLHAAADEGREEGSEQHDDEQGEAAAQVLRGRRRRHEAQQLQPRELAGF